jgi:hypothetical protein
MGRIVEAVISSTRNFAESDCYQLERLVKMFFRRKSSCQIR